MHAGQHAGGMRIRCGHQPVAETQFGQATGQPLLDLRPITKQRAAGPDFQCQRVREIQADLRADAVQPTGQQLAGGLFGARVVLHGEHVAGEHLRS